MRPPQAERLRASIAFPHYWGIAGALGHSEGLWRKAHCEPSQETEMVVVCKYTPTSHGLCRPHPGRGLGRESQEGEAGRVCHQHGLPV